MLPGGGFSGPGVVTVRDGRIVEVSDRVAGRAGSSVVLESGVPSEVLLEPGEDPVPLRSAVNLDSVESVPIAILVERLGRVADHRMRQICAALAIAVDCSD